MHLLIENNGIVGRRYKGWNIVMDTKYNQEQKNLSRESIVTALTEVMKSKNFEDISITEIARRAGVSRMAFYRNYSSMTDVIAERLDSMYQEYSQLLVQSDISNYEVTRLFFYYFRQHREFITVIFKAKLTYLILESMVDFMNDFSNYLICNIEGSKKADKYNIRFVAGGFLNVLMLWMENGMQESDEEMSEIIGDRLSSHISGVKNI